MGSSGEPISGSQGTAGQGGPVTSSYMQYGDSPGITMFNPGSINPSQVNPYANQYLANNKQLYDQFQNSAGGGAFNQDFYDKMKSTQQSQVVSALGNQYASRGLSGSSAEMGGLDNAIQNNQMAWLNREQSDQMKALSGFEGLNQMGYNETMGIQGQYGSFEDAMNQNQLGMLGMQQQQKQADQQQQSQLIGGAFGMAGTAASLAMYS